MSQFNFVYFKIRIDVRTFIYRFLNWVAVGVSFK